MRLLKFFAVLRTVPLVAVASTILPHTLKERGDMADRVVLVQVRTREVQPGHQWAPMKTLTRVTAVRDLKGTGPSEFTIVQIGGAVGTERVEIPGDAAFADGEQAVVFVRCRLAADRCHLVALGEGKLALADGKALARDLFTGQWHKLTLEELQTELTPLTVVPVTPVITPVKGVTP